MIGGFEKTKSLCTIRIYDVEGCKNITINLETPKKAFERYNTKFEDCFEAFLADELKKSVPNCMRANFIPAIKRCLKNVPYLRTSDNRIIEYKFEEVLFSKQSDFQLVQVVDTKDYGRMLILDGFANLAEIDTEDYTHSLMNLPHENYKGKEVLILGGGDGGLMNELLKWPQLSNYCWMCHTIHERLPKTRQEVRLHFWRFNRHTSLHTSKRRRQMDIPEYHFGVSCFNFGSTKREIFYPLYWNQFSCRNSSL